MNDLKATIEKAFDERQSLDLSRPELREAIATAIELLDSGQVRVAEKGADGWAVNQWLKKAVLLYFGAEQSQSIEGGYTNYYDKVPLKFAGDRKSVV